MRGGWRGWCWRTGNATPASGLPAYVRRVGAGGGPPGGLPPSGPCRSRPSARPWRYTWPRTFHRAGRGLAHGDVLLRFPATRPSARSRPGNRRAWSSAPLPCSILPWPPRGKRRWWRSPPTGDGLLAPGQGSLRRRRRPSSGGRPAPGLTPAPDLRGRGHPLPRSNATPSIRRGPLTAGSPHPTRWPGPVRRTVRPCQGSTWPGKPRRGRLRRRLRLLDLQAAAQSRSPSTRNARYLIPGCDLTSRRGGAEGRRSARRLALLDLRVQPGHPPAPGPRPSKAPASASRTGPAPPAGRDQPGAGDGAWGCAPTW